MLYGNLIFIKKTGGDGSKFPVTEKNIKIGRSENCLIRIYNPQVAPEHCQLIIDCNGQAKLRNLFTPTILNGKSLGQGDVTLCHGDVFKLGERLARWEYLPTSKYFKQLLSPTGRLVAVVNPQRRSVENPGPSSSQVSVSKSTPVGSKRKISEKLGSESTSAAKHRRTFGAEGSLKPKIELGKFLMGRPSIKSGKVLLKTPVVTQRKSVAGILSVKTPKSQATEKSRKSIVPSWKVSAEEEEKKKKTPPRKSALKTPSKQNLKNEVRTPSKSTPVKVKTPKNLKLYTKTGDKTSLKTIMESPIKPEESTRSTRSFSKSPPAKVLSTPKQKAPLQAVRLIQSEKKLKSSPGKFRKGSRKMSLVLKRVDKDGRGSLAEKISISGKKSTKGKISSNEDEAQVEVKVSPPVSSVVNARKSSAKDDASVSPTKRTPKRLENSKNVKTTRKSNVLSRRSSVKKVTKDVIETPPLIDFSDEGDSVDTENFSPESIKSSRKSVRKFSTRLIDSQTPQRNVSEIGISTVGKSTGKKSRSTTTPARKSGTPSKKILSSTKKKNNSPRGVRRNLSPSISSAERAAKKLKTSSPKKPDKNKRAALLVLGKANRKQLFPQNVKVLLKQKIVKKAIKQSVTLPTRKNEKTKTQVKKLKKPVEKKQKKSKKESSSSKVSVPARLPQTVKESPVLSKSESNESESNEGTDRRSLVKPKSPSAVTPSTPVKSSPKSSKKPESVPPNKTSNETILPFIKFDKSSESYVFSSKRRCSKRLSSKNDTERPDFVELSPTALGLIPKNIEVFKTLKERKRKSSSLVTPKNVRTTGIIKSASTSKIGNRKSVSFLSKELSVSSTSYALDVNDKTDFDFDSFHTSDIMMDVFVSPLNKSTVTPRVQVLRNENVKSSEKIKSSPKTSVRKHQQTPQEEPPSKILRLSEQNETPKNTVNDIGKARRSLKNHSSDVMGARRLLTTPKQEKCPKNELTDMRGVKKLFSTPEEHKSPKNDLSDVRGVKKLMRTPKVQKSPKNDLSDLRGVKKIMRTPKVQKSPKNDLSDVRGVKKLLKTPKEQKSPKNDLSDVRGIKKLMRTPKAQKSPKNDLSDLRGVKKIMTTPKVQNSPRNDLSDVRGVKKLMRTPKVQKSPKNDLSDVRGVKKIMRTPKIQKSPKNDLSDVRGVKKIMRTPKVQKSPNNDLSDVRGVKKLMKTPEEQKSPKNDLSDVTGVKELFARHKPISDYNISLTGVPELFDVLKDEEKEMVKPEGKKSPDVKETKTGRGRPRKLNEEKQPNAATPKSRSRKEGSVEVITRSTRNRKQNSVADAEKGTSKRRAEVKKSQKRVQEKKAKEDVDNSEEEVRNKSRKRKAVEAVVPSPPKLRRRAAVTTLKEETAEPKTRGKSKALKAEEKTSPISSKKVAEKSKTPAKKIPKVQTKTTKSSAKIQKVQKRGSQSHSKEDTAKRVIKLSPKKTRSAKAKSSEQEVQTKAGRRKK